MVKYSVRLPDDLNHDVNQIAAAERVSKAELTRRGLAVLVERRRNLREIAHLHARLADLEALVTEQARMIAELRAARRS